MLKWIPLVIANLLRLPRRAALTAASVVLAFLLLGLTQAIRSGYSQPVGLAGVHRLLVAHRLGVTEPVPYALYGAVKAVPGVREAAYFKWVNARYGPQSEAVALLAVEPEALLQVYPEIIISPAARTAWLQNRQSALIGTALARKFGIATGQRISVQSTSFLQKDGSSSWPVDVAAVYEVAQDGSMDAWTMFIRYDYFNESLVFGRDRINWIALRVRDRRSGVEVARQIDAGSANSAFETRTASEAEGVEQFLNQVGNVGAALTWIATAILTTMLMVVASALAQSVQERRVEIGVLKALGCSNGQVLGIVLGESVALMLLGGFTGLALAFALVAGMRPAVAQYVPVFRIYGSTVLISMGLMIGIAVLAALGPALHAMRLSISAAMAKGGTG